MDFNIDYGLVQSQKLLLTPQIKQSLNILMMSSQELFEYMEEQIEVNPVLEVADTDECAYDDMRLTTFEQIEWENELQNSSFVKEQDEEYVDKLNRRVNDEVTERLSLKEHLLLQLHASDLKKCEIPIGEYLIDNIDENGYLTANLFEIATFFKVSMDKVEEVLNYIQKFDPCGICSRDLKECLLIQLKQIDNSNEKIAKLVENHLDDLASGNISKVAKSMNLSKDEVQKMYKTIKTLEPRPGREFYNNEAVGYVVGDVIMKKIKDKYEVLINDNAIPAVTIGNSYLKIARKNINKEAKDFIEDKINSAMWLLKCVDLRRNILLKVGQHLVEEEREFFEMGNEYLKLLDVSELAKRLDMHYSIVKQALKNKYIQCLRGSYEMSSFFK